MSIMKAFTVHPRAKAPAYIRYGEYLWEVYGSYSWAKEDAFRQCEKLYHDCGGWDFGIRSYNSFTFIVNWFFRNPDNGRMMLAIITPKYNHAYYC